MDMRARVYPVRAQPQLSPDLPVRLPCLFLLQSFPSRGEQRDGPSVVCRVFEAPWPAAFVSISGMSETEHAWWFFFLNNKDRSGRTETLH
jgi:hypothetical protein